jgi:heme oxygenase (biliverdin-producing, ferredoxin)
MTSTEAALPQADLGSRLREGTRELHRAVERAGAMALLLRGQLPASGYARMLAQLQALYAALEEGLVRHAGHPAVAPVNFPLLYRGAALAHDLASLALPAAPLCHATQAYVERLQQLAARQPALLAAHAYVRYLGDLNGGQTLARVVAASPLLPAGLGTRFYDLGSAADVALRSAAFRAGLAQLPAGPDQADALVDEARWAFAQHGRMFEELLQAEAAGAPQAASPRP